MRDDMICEKGFNTEHQLAGLIVIWGVGWSVKLNLPRYLGTRSAN